MLQTILTEYLCRVPLGTWPEFCTELRPGRRTLIATKSTAELLAMFVQTNLWYLRYAFHFLTSPVRRRPTFFVMGFPKCGTTYFANRLSLHKDIDTPTTLATGGKETMHYRKDQVAHAAMPLRGFYPIFSRAQHLFDACVSYSYDPGAMTWIKEDYPQGKVILVVRNQVNAYESMMNYYNVRLWRKTAGDLAHFDDPEAFRRVPMDKVAEAIEYTRQCQRSSSVTRRSPEVRGMFDEPVEMAIRFIHLRYDRWVDIHLDVFGESNVLVLDFAELTRDPQAVMARTFEFLDLPATGAAVQIESRELKKNVSKKVFRLSDEGRQAMHEVFAPYNTRLHNRTGVDLNQHFQSTISNGPELVEMRR